LAVHPIDNILRPALISNSSQAPFFLVMFGVLGGIAAFGLIGIFLGPVILTIASAVWKEWIDNLPGRVNHMDY
jgi:predicted PurR-regulated permease PerM